MRVGCTVARWQKFLPKSSNVAVEKSEVAGKTGGRSLAEFHQKWQKSGRIKFSTEETFYQTGSNLSYLFSGTSHWMPA